MTTLSELLAEAGFPLPWVIPPDNLVARLQLVAVNHADALAAALREYIAINAKHGYEFDSNEPKLFGQMTAALAAYDAALAEAKGATT